MSFSFRVTRLVVPLPAAVAMSSSFAASSSRASLYFASWFLCFIPQKDRSGLVPAEKVEYVHLALHDEDVDKIG